MEFFIHFMQQIAEYRVNTGIPFSRSKLDRRKAFLFELVLYLILINTPIALPTFFVFLLMGQDKILPAYSFGAIIAIITIALSELLTFAQLRQIVSEENLFPHQQNIVTEEDAKYKIVSLLVSSILGLIPLAHLVSCPLTVINAVQGLEMTNNGEGYTKYRRAYKLLIISAVVIYTAYSTAMVFIPLLLGDARAPK
jgi:hypothetical protein